jgi:hypothetical protein
MDLVAVISFAVSAAVILLVVRSLWPEWDYWKQIVHKVVH